jgi:hypothetical protein
MSHETNKLDAPKRDAREWLRNKFGVNHEYRSSEDNLVGLLEAYALPFIKEAEAAQKQLSIFKDDVTKLLQNIGVSPKLDMTGWLIGFKNHATEKAESERDALREQLQKIAPLFLELANEYHLSSDEGLIAERDPNCHLCQAMDVADLWPKGKPQDWNEYMEKYGHEEYGEEGEEEK